MKRVAPSTGAVEPPVEPPVGRGAPAFVPVAAFVAILVIAPLLVPGPAAGLQAGVYRTGISPTRVVRVPMSGYASRDDLPSLGLHDSLYARALVLDDGRRRMTVVSVDLIGLNVTRDPGWSRLARLLEEAGMDAWLVASTHTHGGPRVLDLDEPYAADRTWPDDHPYTSEVEDRITAAVVTAAQRLQPVRVAAGRGWVELSFNRRLVRPDGTVEMIWGRFAQFGSDELGPTDPEVGVVRLDDEAGNVVAVLANYACHPVVLGSGNRWLTADFPGYAMALVERQWPGSVCLFLQGAAGDLDPRVDIQDDFAPAQQQGETLGREVIRVATELRDRGDLGDELDLAWTSWQRTYGHFSDRQRTVLTFFGLLSVGPRLAFLALPGEPFVGLQLDLKARSPVPHTYLVGYANGYAGYLPTMAAHREGGYGASYGHTLHLEAPAGEDMVEQAVRELRGRVWVEPLPDTLKSGPGGHLRGTLRPLLPPGAAAEVAADLSPLGGSSRQRLAAIDDGAFELDVPVEPDVQPGLHQLILYVKVEGEDERPYLVHPLRVLPGQDLYLWRGGPSPGWQVVGSHAEAEAVSRDGRTVAACRVRPPSTGSLRDIWTLDFVCEAPPAIAGYGELRFAFHPGDTEASPSSRFSMYINERPVDLRGLVDFQRSAWQQVAVPLASLSLGQAEMERLRLWGSVSGTFYLEALGLHVDPLAETAVVEVRAAAAEALRLDAAFPNPFNSRVAIPFVLPEPQAVRLTVHNLAGQCVATPVHASMPAGWHLAHWDGRLAKGGAAASGVYIVRLQGAAPAVYRRIALCR